MAGYIVQGSVNQFYNFTASGSGGGQAVVSLLIEEESGGTGYSQDVVADVVRDAIDAMSGVTTGTLFKHTDALTSLP